jgi:hypothetical protein
VPLWLGAALHIEAAVRIEAALSHAAAVDIEAALSHVGAAGVLPPVAVADVAGNTSVSAHLFGR